MAPFDLFSMFGDTGAYVIYMIIGFCFGFVLESSGFGDSRELAAQFYFRGFRVLKVMFTAIVVAMLLVFWASALGWLNYDELWVNHTYWWPGILGGLIMGVGFVIGGYCPGTSLVSMATLKIDGMMFVLGTLVGVVSFGETVAWYKNFWHAGAEGRLTLPEWLGMEVGWVAVAVVYMALLMFWGAAKIRSLIYGDKYEGP